MDNLNDIKTIWRSANVDGLPTSQEMKGVVRKYRRQKLAKKAGTIMVTLFLLALMIGVVLFYPSVLLTTRIGEGCMLIAIVILVVNNTRSLARVYRLRNLSNKAFLEYLDLAQRGHIRFYKRTQVVGLGLISIGLLLYLFELVYKSLVAFLVAYGLTAVYLLVMWFVVRPRFFQRKKRKFDTLREKAEKIAGQL
jgi:hypothetical protein